ncbi:hypothetical protein K469DRAFT_742693 [Zopfia rhizophila CBS 207.26]|uniref:MFS general substrate transporter n=1 Tax=Zopfia rhizophila CBS 207.26 TaxID=1314779 RepID=A0A6A6DDK8_9PEZI|nr:hypothetical protein K469DRAFT_742693 [Zopfia rhizophila CBS 207.26]
MQVSWRPRSVGAVLEPVAVEPSQAGVKKVERFSAVLYNSDRSGRILHFILIGSTGLTMFAYALDQDITGQFNVIAASSFWHHAEVGAVNTASQIIRTISKPFIAKLSDVTSLPTTYVVVLAFYVIGFVVAATCADIGACITGISFTAFGKSGLDLLSDITVGDLTPLEWRAFWGGMLSTPFLITVFVNGWGLGMVALKLAWKGVIDINLARLLLLGLAFSLVLLNLSLAKRVKGGWSNASMIAMLVVGFMILGLFIAFECLIAPKPIMTRRILKNRAFIAALMVDVQDKWGALLAVTTSPPIFCLFGRLGGIVHRYSHRYKTLMVLGAVLKLIDNAILITGSQRSTQTAAALAAALAISQILLGFGAFTVIGARVGSQASVPHEDLSTVIAGLALWSTLGNKMTPYMREELRAGTPKRRLRRYTEWDDPIRQGTVPAYTRVNGIIFITAISLNAVPVLCSLPIPGNNLIADRGTDYYLGKQQNAVTNTGFDGQPVEVGKRDEGTRGGEKVGFWTKARQAYYKES